MNGTSHTPFTPVQVIDSESDSDSEVPPPPPPDPEDEWSSILVDRGVAVTVRAGSTDGRPAEPPLSLFSTNAVDGSVPPVPPSLFDESDDEGDDRGAQSADEADAPPSPALEGASDWQSFVALAQTTLASASWNASDDDEAPEGDEAEQGGATVGDSECLSEAELLEVKPRTLVLMMQHEERDIHDVQADVPSPRADKGGEWQARLRAAAADREAALAAKAAEIRRKRAAIEAKRAQLAERERSHEAAAAAEREAGLLTPATQAAALLGAEPTGAAAPTPATPKSTLILPPLGISSSYAPLLGQEEGDDDVAVEEFVTPLRSGGGSSAAKDHQGMSPCDGAPVVGTCPTLALSVAARPPPLGIPRRGDRDVDRGDHGPHVFDWADSRTVPFSLPHARVGSSTLSPTTERLKNPAFDEPSTGRLPASAPTAEWEKEVKRAAGWAYEPRNVWPRPSPLPKSSDFSSSRVVTSVRALTSPKVASAAVLDLSGTPLSKGDLKVVKKQVPTLQQLVIVKLRRCGISKLKWTTPAARAVDLRDNNLSSVDNVLDYLSHSRKLEVLLLGGNPVCNDAKLVPRLLVALPLLRKVGTAAEGAAPQVTVAQRVRAIADFGTKDHRRHLGRIAWDLAVRDSGVLDRMPKKWTPRLITKLRLVEVELREIHIATLTALRCLEVPGNHISTLVGSGIERCRRLVTLDLSRNEVEKKAALAPLGVLSRICHVSLADQRGAKGGVKDHRLFLIYLCRHARGTNRATGLVTVDGTPVALVERVDAVHRHGRDGKKRAAAAAWQVHLMDAVGHAQLCDPTFLARLSTLSLPRASLLTVDLSPFPGLQALDLSANQLVKVDGLETPAPTLRLLNLSGNRSLDLKAVLAPLSKHSASLRQVSMCLLDDPKHPRAPTAKQYRMAVLRALLVRNRALNWLDGSFIGVPERGEALRSVFGRRRDAALQRYLFAAAVAFDATVSGAAHQRGEPRLHPEDVSIVTQTQYEPARIRTLHHLANHSLVTAAIDLSLFTSLTHLNLAHNAITDLLPLGLRALQSLVVLDVHDNRVDCSITEVAAVVDSLPALECIALRDNPIMDKPGQAEGRLQLLRALVERKSTSAVKLRVIDTEVSVRDRLACWATEGAAAADNALRLATVEALRLPKTVSKGSLRVLDFAEAGLTSLDLNEFCALEVLLLRGNSFQALTADLRSPPRTLRVLDVRENSLVSVTDTASFLSNKTPLVESLGLAGNPFAKETIRPHRSVRTALLASLPREHLRLRSVDEEPVTADELLSAWSRGEGKDATKLVRFEVVLAARAGGTRIGNLTEVDLSGCNLTVVALSELVMVRRLSLARNELRTLADTGIGSCTELRALDLAHNRLDSASATAEALAPLTLLRALLLHANPCHTSDISGRVRLLGKFYTAAGMTPGTLPLESLDGEEVTIREKCAAASLCDDRRFDASSVSRWRLRLVLRDQGVLSLASLTSLDMSAVGLTSLAPLTSLPNLSALNVADNRLSLIETPVWRNIGAKLVVFDLRRNSLPSLRSVVGALVESCPCLRDVYLAQSTRRARETASRSETAKRVCAVIRYLRSVDGLLNPYGTLSVGGSVGGGAGEIQEPPSRQDMLRAQQAAAAGAALDASSPRPSAPGISTGTMKLARVPSSMFSFTSKEGGAEEEQAPADERDAKYALLFAEEDPSAYVHFPSSS